MNANESKNVVVEIEAIEELEDKTAPSLIWAFCF